MCSVRMYVYTRNTKTVAAKYQYIWFHYTCIVQLDLNRYASVNPHLPSEPDHPYQLDESISNFSGVWCTFSFLLYFE